MKRIYLSYFLKADTPFYGGDGKFDVSPLRSIDAGDSCNTSFWSFPNHAGTHVDLPLHFVNNGRGLHDYLPDFWHFKRVAIIDVSDLLPASVVDPDLLKKQPAPVSTELLLLKTGFGKYRTSEVYWRQNPIFHPELADYFRDRFPLLRAFGFDTISISSWIDRTSGRKAHKAFLEGEKPILLIEDVDLSCVGSTTIFISLTVAPILVNNADASPCTVIAEVIE